MPRSGVSQTQNAPRFTTAARCGMIVPVRAFYAQPDPDKGSVDMENATITIPEPVFERARIKAQQEDRAVDQLVTDLLDRWVAGEIQLPAPGRSREELVALACAARGMWADRDPDRYLAAGRAGHAERDVELYYVEK